MKLLLRCLWLSPLCFSLIATAQPVYFSVPGPDAPELAKRGPFSVGVRTLELLHRDQVDILTFDKATGKAP